MSWIAKEPVETVEIVGEANGVRLVGESVWRDSQ